MRNYVTGEVKGMGWDRPPEDPVTPKTYECPEAATHMLSSQGRQASRPGPKQKQPATKALGPGCPTERSQVLLM